MANLGKFQTLEFSYWSPKVIKDTHIITAYHEDPQRANEFMTQLMAYRRGPTMYSELSKLKIKQFERNDEYTWDVISNSRRNIPLVEARHQNGQVVAANEMAGVGGEEFYVVFPEYWFHKGDVIVGHLNEVYPIRLLGEPRMEGTNVVHRCELMGGITTGIPGSRLQAGERFSQEYAPVSKGLSRGVSGIHFMAPSQLRNEFSMIRKETKMSGDLIDRKIAVGVPVIDEKTGHETTINRWMQYVDMQFEEEFYCDINNLILFGRSNRTSTGEYLNFDPSGEIIRMGAGLKEQCESANYMKYSKFSLKLIEDAIESVIKNLPPSSIPHVVNVRTGRAGMKLANKAIANEVSGWKLFTANADAVGAISKTTSTAHSNALRAGFMFTEWQAPMNVIVKFTYDATKDDPVRNKLYMADGTLAESQSFDFNLMGGDEYQNITLCTVKNGDFRSIIPGVRDPFTGSNHINFASTDEDGASIQKGWTGGVMVQDPTATFTLKPAVLVG